MSAIWKKERNVRFYVQLSLITHFNSTFSSKYFLSWELRHIIWRRGEKLKDSRVPFCNLIKQRWIMVFWGVFAWAPFSPIPGLSPISETQSKGPPACPGRDPSTDLFLPCPGLHHLGPQLDSVILVILFGSGNLLSSLPQFILGIFLPMNALLKLSLKTIFLK